MMNHDSFVERAFELALAEAGRRVPPLSLRRGSEQTTVETAAPGLDGHGFLLADLTFTKDGPAPIELNGSNAAMSSLADGDLARVGHMVEAFLSRNGPPEADTIALLLHQRGFYFISEFYSRAARFAAGLAKSGGAPVALTRFDDVLVEGALNVVVGSIEEAVGHIQRDGMRLQFRGRPVAFLVNPNVYPELVRRGKIAQLPHGYGVDLSITHDDAAVPIVHDKSLQLDLTAGTGLQELRHWNTWDVPETAERVRELQHEGSAAVIKMNAGSQGAGVEIVSPKASMNAVVLSLRDLVDSARRKYGESVERTMWPLRVVEFVEAATYSRAGAGYLWDVRVQCLLSRGRIRTVPCVVRLCPEPFCQRTYSRGGVVSNVSGRRATVEHMRRPDVVFAKLGLDMSVLHEVTAAWARAAWTQCHLA